IARVEEGRPKAAFTYRRSLEVDLHRDLREARREDAGRDEPGAVLDERLVVGLDRIAVQRVVEIQRELRAQAVEPDDLAEAKIELVDAIAVDLARRHEVDCGIGRTP